MPTGARQSVHELEWPDRVVVGTVGVPGQRTFYLQVRTGKQILSIALEKQQAAQLAEKIDEVLDQLRTVEGNPFHVPTSTPIELVDNDDLEPVQEQFRAGVMSLGRDPTTAQLVGTAQAFAKRTREVVGAGRPICVICGQPMDADGHTCTFPEN